MRDREYKTAKEFNVLEKVQKLEKELGAVEHLVDVDFDLSGLYSDIFQVIMILKYDIPAPTENYFEVRRKFILDVLKVAKDNDLRRTEDRIEDFGEHFYIVTSCGKTWRELMK